MLSRLSIATRQADPFFLVNELDRLNATSGSPFGGRLDPARLGIMGHFLGGAAALHALRVPQRN